MPIYYLNKKKNLNKVMTYRFCEKGHTLFHKGNFI